MKFNKYNDSYNIIGDKLKTIRESLDDLTRLDV